MRKTKGFTLVEIMVVVAIVGLLSIIAIPNSVRAREQSIRNSCFANIKQLSNSLERAALETGVSILNLSSDEISNVLVPDYVRSMPECRSGGNYYSDGSGEVHCSVHYP